MNSPLYILEYANFNFRYVRLCDLDILREKKMVVLFANRGDPDQIPIDLDFIFKSFEIIDSVVELWKYLRVTALRKLAYLNI